MLDLSLPANLFGLCWTPDGYSTKSASSYRSQAPFLRRYKSLLDVVTGSDWSISTAPQPWWKISGLSEGGMAFVHPTVTDHVLTVTHPPPTPSAGRTTYSLRSPQPSFAGFFWGIYHLSAAFFIYLHLISVWPVRPISTAPALIHLRAAEAHSTPHFVTPSIITDCWEKRSGVEGGLWFKATLVLLWGAPARGTFSLFLPMAIFWLRVGVSTR